MLESIIISTLEGSIICTALLIFKNKILSALGGKALYYISLIAMLVFILPMNIGDISLPKVPVNQTINVTEFETTTPEAENDNTTVAAPQPEVKEEMQHNALPQASNMVRRSNPITMQEILLAVWLLGFIISMCRYFISYFRFKKKICGFDVRENINGARVIKSPLIASPLVFGFFKPTLAIPEIEMNEDDYNLAIKHEMVHYKHHDSWFKLFAVIVNSICWFNPITYFMVNLIGEACEYACDEQVTKEMDMADKKQYSAMILSMVCQSSPALSSNMAKSKKQLKRRFEMIMKKKRFSVLRTAICTVLMLALTCGSVVLANEIEPLVSSLMKDDYVYISNYGNGAYNEFVPVEKDGAYYLPLREFLNKSDIKNDKIKYDNGTITVDIWTNQLTVYSSSAEMGPQEYMNGGAEKTGEIIPSQYSWSSTCKIGSREVDIDGNKHILKNTPYIENGITYVPYEYFQLMQTYEYMCKSVGERIKLKTSKFNSLMMFGFDSSKAEYYTDYIQISEMVNVDSYAHVAYNATAKVARTGYRTEFEAECNYFDLNNTEKRGEISVKLNEVTRIYSKGSDIEGLFTVIVDGETIYENEKGYITTLPIPAGEGIISYPRTILKVGELGMEMYFFGFNSVSEEYDSMTREKGKLTELPDTVKLTVVPESVKLNGYKAIRGDKMYSNLMFSREKKMIDMDLHFDSYDGQNGENAEFYRIHTETDSKMSVIDENTISAELYFTYGNNTRIDSFEAIITILPDNSFELKSTDGNYIVRGYVAEYTPQWQWSEEQKNAPVPQVVMIDE